MRPINEHVSLYFSNIQLGSRNVQRGGGPPFRKWNVQCTFSKGGVPPFPLKGGDRPPTQQPTHPPTHPSACPPARPPANLSNQLGSRAVNPSPKSFQAATHPPSSTHPSTHRPFWIQINPRSAAVCDVDASIDCQWKLAWATNRMYVFDLHFLPVSQD